MSNLSPRRRSSQDYALRRAESSEPGHGSDPSGLIAHFTWHMTIYITPSWATLSLGMSKTSACKACTGLNERWGWRPWRKGPEGGRQETNLIYFETNLIYFLPCISCRTRKQCHVA